MGALSRARLPLARFTRARFWDTLRLLRGMIGLPVGGLRPGIVTLRLTSAYLVEYYWHSTGSSASKSVPISGQINQSQTEAIPMKTMVKPLSDRVLVKRTEPDQKVDRKSTRLNSSHLVISYAVFCLKKKKDQQHVST